jgi:hypothetical protein
MNDVGWKMDDAIVNNKTFISMGGLLIHVIILQRLNDMNHKVKKTNLVH